MKVKVIFVCLGNICRSPMAEAIFKHLVRKANIHERFEITSAGTADYHINCQPDHRTLEICKTKDILIDHCGRQLSAEDLDYYDYVVAMDLNNLTHIKRLAKSSEQLKKIHLMRHFSTPNQDLIVPDPYYGNIKDFEHVYDILTEACQALLDRIKKEVN